MASKSEPDPRLVVGQQIHVRATSIFSSNHVRKRAIGVDYMTTMLTGVVQRVELAKSASGGKLTYLIC